jgi:hypothetical protein
MGIFCERNSEIFCGTAHVACLSCLTPSQISATTSLANPTTIAKRLPSRARELARLAPDGATLWQARRWRWSLLEKLVSTSFCWTLG